MPLVLTGLLMIFAFSGLVCKVKQQPAEAGYQFLPVDSLPDNPVMPDPFRKPDGTRVKSLDEWPGQRTYLRAMLEHYLYGHVPPRPAGKDLSFSLISDEGFTPPDSEEAGRKQVYSVILSRDSLSHSFNFTLWRPEEVKRYPTLINNHLRPQSTQPAYSMEEGVRRGYMVVVFNREEVAPDDKANVTRREGIFRLYPEYDFYTIAAWAWAYQPVIDVLNELGVIDMEKIIATGHSRGGQTAMAAGIFDERIAVIAPSTGGPWSVGSYRQRDPDGYRGEWDYAEQIKKSQPHWYHPRFTEFINKEEKLPFDAPTMAALTAPRPLLNVNAIGDGVNNGLAHEAGIRAGILIYGWMGAEKWCRIHWRDHANSYGQKGHDQGPEEYNAIFDFADEYFFHKAPVPGNFNIAPGGNTWLYDPEDYPLLIDWQVPSGK